MHRARRARAGFTVVELLVTIAIVIIMATAAAPLAQSTLSFMRLRAAATAVSGAMQSTRFQAISAGYQFKVAFDKTKHTYQLSSDPTGSGTFTNVGSAIPFSGSSLVLNNNATLLFSPSGKVSFAAGASPLVLKLQGQTGTITVSSYGNVSVKYGS